MTFHGKALFLGRHRTVYAAIAVVSFGFVLFNTRIVELFLMFAFGGIIPGTDIILPAETVMILMTGLAVLTVLLSVIRLAVTRARKRRHSHRAMTVVAKVSKVAMEVSAVGQSPARSAMAASPVKAAAAVRTVPVVHSIFSSVRLLSFAITALSVKLAYATWSAGMSSWRWLVRTMVVFWRWSEPLLRKCDEWLELRVRSLESRVSRQIQASPLTHAIRNIRHGAFGASARHIPISASKKTRMAAKTKPAAPDK